ncbi:MAG: arginine--tRNA ligase [Candidatus Niyogibacteria bacterium]|nr:arginine--tRNA ligase [Candidatus Niyogibacteria bacterium]
MHDRVFPAYPIRAPFSLYLGEVRARNKTSYQGVPLNGAPFILVRFAKYGKQNDNEFMTTRDFLKTELKKAIFNLYGKEINFEVAAEERFGDYATNAALVLRTGNPKEVAQKLADKLRGSARFNEYVEKTEVAGPGFLNFWLSHAALRRAFESLGKKFPKKAGKINLEFISANPTGKLHIGHGRGAFYGDALSRVFVYAGCRVDREYFINDSKESAQIKELGKTALGEGTKYLTDYLSVKRKAQSAKLKNLQPIRQPADYKLQTNLYGEAGFLLAEEIQKDNKKFIEADLGIKFGKWYSEEGALRAKGIFEKTLTSLQKEKLVYEKDGAMWLKTAEFGDDEDRVVVRSDKSYSYFLSDITYHADKFKRGYKKVIDIWGADHHGHVKRMEATKKMLGWKGDLNILISQLVTLKVGALRKKFSKRAGNVIYLEDLLREVGIDALRWFFLDKALNTHMDFDLELAKKQSAENPVYYVQYAHARISSILKNAKGGAKLKKRISIVGLQHPSELALIKKLARFSEIVEDTAADYQVHRLTSYAYELAYAFSGFYRDVRVLNSGENEAARIYLISETQKILKTVLGLLGINAPDKM